MSHSSKILEQIKVSISAAASSGNFDRVGQLTKNAKRVQEIVSTQIALENELGEIERGLIAEPVATIKALSVSSIFAAPKHDREMRDEESHGDVSVVIDFPKLGVNRSVTTISERKVSMTLLKTITVLADTMGPNVLEKLAQIRVSRGPLVSNNPRRDYLNNKTGELYAHHQIGQTGFHVLTHSATAEKIAALRDVAEKLGIPNTHFRIKHAA